MVSSLALRVPPTHLAQDRQASELAAERNQSWKEKQTEGCRLSQPREGLCSGLTVRYTQ